MAVSNDWELEFDGLLIGGDSEFGVVSIQGLLDLPEVRSSDLLLLRRHGAYAGDDFLSPREVTLELSIYASSQSEMELRMAEFAEAFTVGDEQVLSFQIPGVADGVLSRLWCRTKRRSVNLDLEYKYGVAKAMVQLLATDPRIYSDVESTDSEGLLEVADGHTFDMSWPLTFPVSTSGGYLTLVNSGSFDAPVLFRIDGPVTDPAITNDTTGEYLAFTGTIADGDYYLVDTGARSVLLNGTASRYNTLDADSTWFDLVPGSNTVVFSAPTFEATALLTATWRDASV